RAEVRAELERIAPLVNEDGKEDDGWRKLIELYEVALQKSGTSGDSVAPLLGLNLAGPQLGTKLGHELAMKVASGYDERLEDSAKAVEYYRRALHLEPDDSLALEALDR